jgi:hypothetical protein
VFWRRRKASKKKAKADVENIMHEQPLTSVTPDSVRDITLQHDEHIEDVMEAEICNKPENYQKQSFDLAPRCDSVKSNESNIPMQASMITTSSSIQVQQDPEESLVS